MKKENNSIIIYKDSNGKLQVEVRLEGDTVWLTIEQISLLFNKSRSTINEHIINIFKEKELSESSSMKKIGNSDFSTKPTNYYNLDVIISVGYRVKSAQGTKFRQWATERIKDYVIKGFVIDDERLKNLGGGIYWKELLDRIRDIRSSEKVLYRQVLDLYATSIDYDPKSSESIEFFKIVQNKLHYAVHGHTAAEIIAERANAGKPFMGLLTFSKGGVVKKDIAIAKNYLTEEELKVLNNLVSGYFDFAEIQAMKKKPMRMKDYIKQLDNILQATGEELLSGAGGISHKQAIDKAEGEYKKYQENNLSSAEKDFLESIKLVEKKLGKDKEK